ncbi:MULTISPECIES: hypothetical protein [Nostoc]|uniref:Uncharacterized protein n=2 Tax=Nostoc TaxID=1177 RepID=A0ABR8I5K7_9NOSO|nr:MULTISPECIES: hypothetical protein [Nostoc]MBD2646197.1 hypothetical protein [Nostoc foliaceum FACHB-393]
MTMLPRVNNATKTLLKRCLQQPQRRSLRRLFKSNLIVQNTSAPSTTSVGRTIQLSYQVKTPGVYEDYFGIGIYSAYPGNKYEFLPGTSMAALTLRV